MSSALNPYFETEEILIKYNELKKIEDVIPEPYLDNINCEHFDIVQGTPKTIISSAFKIGLHVASKLTSNIIHDNYLVNKSILIIRPH